MQGLGKTVQCASMIGAPARLPAATCLADGVHAVNSLSAREGCQHGAELLLAPSQVW
jgi:hypothetical protein